MVEAAQFELARGQIEFVRTYTHTLIEDLEDDLWFVQPEVTLAADPTSSGKKKTTEVTHIAWQVGHLAMAEYMLTLFRIRGKLREDNQLIDKKFIRLFLKGTTPEADPKKYPSPSEIRQVFDAVHQQVLLELADFPLSELDEPVVMPYSVHPNRLGSLLFCATHEMVHAGQIGLLRRLLGRAPVR